MSENTVVQISKIQIEVIFEIFHVAKMELTDNCVFVKFDFKNEADHSRDKTL